MLHLRKTHKNICDVNLTEVTFSIQTSEFKAKIFQKLGFGEWEQVPFRGESAVGFSGPDQPTKTCHGVNCAILLKHIFSC